MFILYPDTEVGTILGREKTRLAALGIRPDVWNVRVSQMYAIKTNVIGCFAKIPQKRFVPGRQWSAVERCLGQNQEGDSA